MSLSVTWKELSNVCVFISDYFSIFVLSIDKLPYSSVIVVRRGNPVFAMKAHMGTIGITPLILNLGARLK
jgi:hypothetical protein